MRMSCGGWTGGSSNPGALPRRTSLAYRRYLRYLPGYNSSRDRDDHETPISDDPEDPPVGAGGECCHGLQDNDPGAIDFLAAITDEGDAPRKSPEDRPCRREKEILRERGLSRWLKDQEETRSSTETLHKCEEDSKEEDRGRKDDVDTKPDIVSVRSRVRQYTAMLSALNSASSASPNALQTSRSCSSLLGKTAKLSRFCGPPRSVECLKDGRQGSIESGDGDSSDSLLGPRNRSFSLPWPSETNWRWSSDPNIMSDTAPPSSATGEAQKPVRDINQHSNSLARLDSGTSDEGCPRDGSTGPTPPLSPVFRGLGPNHLHGLITPFKSLSPASSMGSHLGSIEDIPLARSMSFGHVLDHLTRSRSADSAVEVEDDSHILSQALSSAAQQQQNSVNGNQEGSNKSGVNNGDHDDDDDDDDVGVCTVIRVGGNGSGFGSSVCKVCAEGQVQVSKSYDNDQCRMLDSSEVEVALPNGDISCEESDTNHVFCECVSGEKSEGHNEGRPHPVEEKVELRRKGTRPSYAERRERRLGEVDGDKLLRRARGCGGLLQDSSDDSCRKVLRTPSVVISDHSGDTVSLTVALASSDFSIEKLEDKFQPPRSLSPSSSPSLCVSDDASRKVSSCSSCSSVSTVDMSTPLTPMLAPGLDCSNRRISDCSTASNVTISEDEIDHILPRPPPPKKQSNWRKLRNIVQWTPFIQTYKKHKYPWVQLAGHQGNFRAGYKQGTILKKLCPPEEKALEAIMKDVLRPYVPLYMGVVEGTDGEKYLQLQDLLSDFELPCVMDIKMGVRTYLEDELAKAREKPKLRKDMYDKMVQIDPKAPTEQEHRAKAVTKPRYMVWRETISSTATQGFRIEGVRRGDGTSSKDFKTTRTREQVLSALNSFLQGYPHAASRYVQQLKSIKVTLEASPFFNSHELIGSSLLFVHNDTSATVRMIDFAKTIPLPENVHVTHRSPWSEGTHEDGYLLGLDNLIDLFSIIEKNMAANESNKTGLQNSAPQEQTNSSGSSNSNDASTANKGFDGSSSNCNATTTTISASLPTVNNHTAVPVNASLT
ncbi:uncharacterized protein [Macrobrachium rosenbergii]|uniref:uncharacterized protein n=1 Tax=Macrobrachium rosenbergii TaxID=79674 RepID=UPI0034D6060E